MSRSRIVAIALLSLLSVLVAACGQGGSGGLIPDTPSTGTAKVEGIVYVPGASVQTMSLSVSPLALQGQTPFEGAKVTALTLPDLKPVGTTATTDQNGMYVISGVPVGIPVVVVAIKEIDGKEVRLSTYVAETSDDTKADIDVVTSLATEVVVKEVKKSSLPAFPTEVFEELLGVAEMVALQSNLTLESIFVGAGIFSENLGEGLSDDFDGKQALELPGVGDPALLAAKSAVVAARNIAFTIAGPDEQSVVNRLMRLYEEGQFTEENGTYVSQVLFQIGALVHVATLIPSYDLEPGWVYPWDFLEQSHRAEMESHWIIEDLYGIPGLEAKVVPNESVNDYRYTVTISGDIEEFGSVSAEMKYNLSDGTMGYLITDAVGGLQGGELFEFKFPQLGEDGTFEFSGTLNTHFVDLSGSVTVTNVDKLLQAFQLVNEKRADEIERFEVVIQASNLTKLPNLEVDGDFELKLAVGSARIGDIPVRPARIFISGNLFELDTKGGKTEFLGARFEAEEDLTDAFDFEAPFGPDNFFKGYFSFTGSIHTPGRRSIWLDVTFASTAFGGAELSGSLAYGDDQYEISMVLDYEYDEKTHAITPAAPVSLVLTNEAKNLTLTFTVPEEVDDSEEPVQFGSIVVGGEEVATIESYQLGVRVKYRTGEFETLP